MYRRISALFVLALSVAPLSAQIIEVPLERRTDLADLIVEARVESSTSFIERDRPLIHTAHTLKVFSVWKGLAGLDADLETLEIVTPGGRVGNEWHVVQPALTLRPGDVGVFFLKRRLGFAGRSLALVPAAGTQSLVRYRAFDGVAADPFREYPEVETDLFRAIERETGQPATELAPATRPTGPSAAPASHTISGLSPLVVNAGVKDILTITGSGFGTYTGSATVFFDDPDDGLGGSYTGISPEHVVSWVDNEIQVYVPDQIGSGAPTAGSGSIIVRDSGGSDVFSTQSITVEYAISEIVSSGELYRISHENENGIGGFTFQASTATANNGVDFTSVPGAMDRFAAALETWNCSTGWNVEFNGTTSISEPVNDGVNIVAFDNDADPITGGTIGRATSYFSSCGGDTWHVTGLDIRFRRDGNGVDWYYGADPGSQPGSQSDFESTALHELGHAVQHSHVNDTSDTMYYTIQTGTNRRTLSPANVAGAVDIVAYSAPYASCGETGMTVFDCLALPSADFTSDTLGACGTSVTVDFTDLSSNGPTAWMWDFGDGGTSTQRNPSHTYNAPGLYTVSLTSSNINGSDNATKTDYIVLTNDPATASCDPTFTGHNSCCSIGIRNVTLAGVNNTTQTASEGDPLLEDFTCTQFATLAAGSTESISITTGQFNDEDVRVWIDWNDDGTLDATELAFSSDNDTTHSGTITVPAGAVTNTALRMRVASDFGFGIPTACSSIGFGQVEDYSVIVSAAGGGSPGEVPDGSTAPPLFVDKNPGTPTDVDLSWGASCSTDATDYTIHEGEIGSWYGHSNRVCSTGGATSFAGLTPGFAGSYYLVVPVTASEEGSYGKDSAGIERPVSGTVCLPAQNLTACP